MDAQAVARVAQDHSEALKAQAQVLCDAVKKAPLRQGGVAKLSIGYRAVREQLRLQKEAKV